MSVRPSPPRTASRCRTACWSTAARATRRWRSTCPATATRPRPLRPPERNNTMASLGATYDASQGDQMSERSALPAGEYLAAIAKSDVSDTKAGDGRKIDLEFEVLDGAHKGRRFWSTLNLWNRNAQAVEIAQRE